MMTEISDRFVVVEGLKVIIFNLYAFKNLLEDRESFIPLSISFCLQAKTLISRLYVYLPTIYSKS